MPSRPLPSPTRRQKHSILRDADGLTPEQLYGDIARHRDPLAAYLEHPSRTYQPDIPAADGNGSTTPKSGRPILHIMTTFTRPRGGRSGANSLLPCRMIWFTPRLPALRDNLYHSVGNLFYGPYPVYFTQNALLAVEASHRCGLRPIHL